jgi:hypothetical protein
LGDQPGWDSEILAEAMEKFESVVRQPSNIFFHIEAKILTLNRSRNTTRRLLPTKRVTVSWSLVFPIMILLVSGGAGI